MNTPQDDDPFADFEFEDDEEIPFPRHLDQFLETHGLLVYDSGHSETVHWPLEDYPDLDKWVEVYARNFGYNSPFGTFTIARVSIGGIDDTQFPAHTMHGTGGFRSLIQHLETVLPQHGYHRIVVEMVGNDALAKVLRRYGFEEFELTSFHRDIKDLSNLASTQEASARRKAIAAAADRNQMFMDNWSHSTVPNPTFE